MNVARILSGASRLVDALVLTLVGLALACVALTTLGPHVGHPALVIEGGSMQPTIPLGALVILDQGAPADLHVGDVVSFRADNGTIVTHRVTRLAQLDGAPWFGTKGDANAEPDPTITPDSAILGRVAWSIPGAGELIWLLARPIGIAAAVLVAATLLVFAMVLEELAFELGAQPRRRPGLAGRGSSAQGY